MQTVSATSSPGLLEKFNTWLQESIMIKLFSIGFMILILLIPSSWISELIYERQSRAGSVIQEVSDKWSGMQTISGPILIVPYKVRDVVDRGKDGVEIHERVENAYFLPDQLNIDGIVKPETRHRGIFDVVVYESSLKINSSFSTPAFDKLNIAPEMIQWKDAYMVFGITDLRGISDNPAFTVGSHKIVTEPSNNIGVSVRTSADNTSSDYRAGVVPSPETISQKGITAKLPWTSAEDFNGLVKMNINLKGSKRLNFVPTGKTTDVRLAGSWQDPSFDGEFVPSNHQITEEGFTADWKILHFNRPFSQEWANQSQTLSGADFGVKLLMPVDQYQKSTRTAKYGILVILLTFIALFLVEITQKIRIHPFQYILIGAALIIYYVVLLSLSEHIGYNIAYIISSVATIVLVTLYSTSFLSETRLSMLLGLLLVLAYGFIFVIILQQDFSLLIGSVGLFIIISMLMYFSRKVRWYSSAQ